MCRDLTLQPQHVGLCLFTLVASLPLDSFFGQTTDDAPATEEADEDGDDDDERESRRDAEEAVRLQKPHWPLRL